MPIFGGRIEDGLSREGQSGGSGILAPFMMSAFHYIENDVSVLGTSGLFLLPGAAENVRAMREALERGEAVNWGAYRDPHAVCTVVKEYVRELRPPLVPDSLAHQFLEASSLGARPEEKSAMLRVLLGKLPPLNHALLARLFVALKRISRWENQNDMTVAELARVMVDCIFFPLRASSSSSSSPVVGSTDLSEGVLVNLIRQASLLFDPAEASDQQLSFDCFVCALDVERFPSPSESATWIAEISQHNQKATVQLALRRLAGGTRAAFSASFSSRPLSPSSSLLAEDAAERVQMTDSPLQWVFKSPVGGMPASSGPRRHRRSPSSGEQKAQQERYLGFAFADPSTSVNFLTELTVMADRYENFYKLELGENEPITDGWYDTDIPRFDGTLPQLEALRVAARSDGPAAVILADATVDLNLRTVLSQAEDLMRRFSTLDNKARMLALHVANAMGGFGFSAEELEQLAGQCISSLAEKHRGRVVQLGDLRYGNKLHRAILFKYLADNIRPAMPCRLSWKRESVYMPLHSDIRKYKRVSLDDARLLKQTRKEHISTTGSPGRIINLPDLQTSTLEVLELCGGVHSNTYRCKIGSIVCAVKIYTKLTTSPSASTPTSSPASSLSLHASSSSVNSLSCSLPFSPAPLSTLASLSSSAPLPPPLSPLGAPLPFLPAPAITAPHRGVSQDEVFALKRLVSLQISLSNPNVLCCLGYEETATEFRILYEYAAGGTLYDQIVRRKKQGAPFSTAEICCLAIHMATALVYLHSKGTAHRDIRSDNIMLDGDPAHPEQRIVKLCGIPSPRDVSPMQCHPPESPYINPSSEYGWDPLKSDMWAFGLLLIELATLGPPYQGFDFEKQKEWVRQGKLPPNTDRTSVIFTLIKMCTHVDPNKRSTAQACLDWLVAQ